MSWHDLIAVIHGGDLRDIPPGLSAHRSGATTVLLGARRTSALWRPSRKKVLAGMVTRQRHLEALLGTEVVLPVLPGTLLRPCDTDAFARANEDLLARLARELHGQVQFQITASWEPKAAAARFGWSDEHAAIRGTAALAERARAALDRVAAERLDLPRTPDMLLNAAILIGTGAEEALDAALEAIDGFWTEGLRIRRVGPSPAVSFASLGLRHVTRGQTRAARAALGLRDGAGAEDLAAARRRALMSAPPEAQGTIREAADLLGASLRAGTETPPLARIWREGQAEAPRGLDRVA